MAASPRLGPPIEAAIAAGSLTAIASVALPSVHVGASVAALVVFAGAASVALIGASIGTRASVSGRRSIAAGLVGALALIAVALTSPAERFAAPIVDAALIAIGVGVGGAIGARIEHPGHLLPASIVAACADVVSVLSPHGPTHAIAASEHALSLLALSFPVPGTTSAAPALGLGDVVFLALLLAAATAHRLPRARVAALAALGIAAAGALSAWLEAAVPALPLLGLAVVAGVGETRRLRRRDRRIAWTAGSIAVAAAAAVALRAHLSR